MKKIRTVILTGEAGQGHISIANAFKHWLRLWGYDAEVYNVLPDISGKIVGFLYRSPEAYRSLFDISNKPSIAQATVSTLSLEVEKRIEKAVPDYQTAELVISTYPLIRPRHGKVKIMLLPDPVAHAAYFVNPKPDYYFAFWQQSLSEAEKFGEDKNRVVFTGPLARPSFYEVGKLAFEPKYKLTLRRKFGIPDDYLLILVMAGSAWIDRSEKYLDLLRQWFKNEKVFFVFVCGKNQKFLKEMSLRYKGVEFFRFLGWLTEVEMAKWMSSADYGLAFSLAQMSVEAGLVGLPLFIFRLIEGQEEGYRSVVSDHGVGMFFPGKPEDQVILLKVLIKQTGLFRRDLKAWQKELISSLEKIKSFLNSVIKE